MTTPNSTLLDPQQQRQFCSVLQMGCDRETACHFLGISAGQLHHALLHDAPFLTQVLRAEASPEFNHMRNIYNAGKDEKHWRASVWWLERSAPERYARRATAALTTTQLRQAVEELAEVLLREIDDPQAQQRLLARLGEFAQQVRGESFQPAPGTEPEQL